MSTRLIPALLALFAAALVPSIETMGHAAGPGTSRVSAARSLGDLGALDGPWLYVQDRTAGRALEDQQPPMSPTFGIRVEEGALVVERGSREERYPLDGSVNEVVKPTTTTLYQGAWRDGAFETTTEIVRNDDAVQLSVIRRAFRPTDEGLLLRVVVGEPAELDSTALYQHPDDIALPAAAEATIDDMAWLAGPWTGSMGSASIEERWSPPKGGAMLATSRTVAGGRMVMFEFLRIVEREGGLVYVAQPGGGDATEFVLTSLEAQRAVFDNPRHDFPQRIVYALSDDGALTASIGFVHGGRPQTFGFTREAE